MQTVWMHLLLVIYTTTYQFVETMAKFRKPVMVTATMTTGKFVRGSTGIIYANDFSSLCLRRQTRVIMLILTASKSPLFN